MLSATSWNWGAKSGLFYAGSNLLCIIWCYFRLPETKGRTFGEIDLLFENHVPARKFKKTQVDRKSWFPEMLWSRNADYNIEFAHGSMYNMPAEDFGKTTDKAVHVEYQQVS